jgi:hypothetical protein
MKKNILAALAVLALGTPLAAKEPRHRPHGPPPQEAVDACAKATAGDTCDFTIHGHDVDGVCRAAPDGNGALACIPDHPMGPPPEALAACANLATGDACHVNLGDRSIDGTCRQGPDGQGPLACAPAHPDGPPPQ